MNRILGKTKMWVIDLLVRIRQSIPIQPTWKFVTAVALTAAIVFGFLAWLADAEARAKQRQSEPVQHEQGPGTQNTTYGAQSPIIPNNSGSVMISNEPSSSGTSGENKKGTEKHAQETKKDKAP